jgi:putative hydrolase of the HAD superfamily
LNWKAHYRDGLLEIGKRYTQALDETQLQKGELILAKYNTRMNPRLHEVSSNLIFKEMFDAWGRSAEIDQAKSAFFSYFRRQVDAYADVLPTLQELRRQGVRIGVLTDVPYGMDREFVLEDCRPIIDHVDVLLTSVDVGYRKPHVEGYMKLSALLGVSPSERLNGQRSSGQFGVVEGGHSKWKSH